MRYFGTIEEEMTWYDKLGQAFTYFQYHEKYGWTFEKYVEYVEKGILQEVLGNK